MIAITVFRKEHFFLSNFYPCVVNYKGYTGKSSEHLYQAMKCLNEEERHIILNCATAADAKREVRNYAVHPDFEENKLDIMKEIMSNKFKLNEDLRIKLRDTDPFLLIHENNWGDKFWGTVDGNGANWQGELMMQIRDEIIKEELENN